jgi:hypothetical protein
LGNVEGLGGDTARTSPSVRGDTVRTCRCIAAGGAPSALTAAFAALGQAEPGHTLGEDALQRCRRALGPDHPITRYLTQATEDH